MNAAAVDTGAALAHTGPGWGALLWFLLIVAAIPMLLWLFKRTPLGGAGLGSGAARSLGQLALSAQQKVVTVEVGQGDERRWLVLGVTPHSITTLHSMAPQGDLPAAGAAATAAPGFAALLNTLRPPRQP